MRGSFYFACAAACALLSACGGGDGSDGGQPQPQKYSKDDVRETAQIGLLMHKAAITNTSAVPYLLGAVIQSFATDTGGSRVVPLTCSTGTGNLQLNKTSAHTGLTVGDEIVFNYNKCVTSKFTLSGTAKVTLRANVQPSATGDLNTNFDVLLTLFSIATSTAFDIFDGTANMKSSSTGSLNTITNEFTVPAGQTLTFATSTSRFDYLGGTSYSETDSVAPNSVSSRLDGTLRIQQTLETRNYSIKTLSPLVGTFSSAGAFTPTSGVIESTHVERNLATSTTISGINAQVSGDTDQNGSKDLTFTELTSSLLH